MHIIVYNLVMRSSKTSAYITLSIAFVLWTLFILFLDTISNSWELSFYVIAPFAFVYPLIELSLRPLSASFLYSKILKIFGIIISLIIWVVSYFAVGLMSCCGGESSAIFDNLIPLVVASPFLYYSIIQHRLWVKYSDMTQRKVFVLKSRIITGAVIFVLVANTLLVAINNT